MDYLKSELLLLKNTLIEMVEDYRDQTYQLQMNTIMETILWPCFIRIVKLFLLITTIVLIGVFNAIPFSDLKFQGFLIGYVSACIVILVYNSFLKQRFTKQQKQIIQVLLMLILDTFGQLVCSQYSIIVDTCEAYHLQILQLVFSISIIKDLRYRFFILIKYYVYEIITGDKERFLEPGIFLVILLIILMIRYQDIQLIQLARTNHLVEQSLLGVPSAVCIISQNCDQILFHNSFMKRIISKQYREHTLTLTKSVRQINLAEIDEQDVYTQFQQTTEVLDFIQHLYVNLDDVKQYIHDESVNQARVQSQDFCDDDILINLEDVLVMIQKASKKVQQQIFTFQSYFCQDENIKSIEQNESKLKVVIEVRIKTQIQYGSQRNATLMHFYDISTNLRSVAYKKMNRFKSQVIRSISHELKTRLNVIQGMIQVLQTETKFDRMTESILNIIFNNCRIQDFIIGSIIDYNLLREGSIQLSIDECSLTELILDVFQLFQNEADKKQINLSLQIDPLLSNSKILTDIIRLKSALVHFISNSIKHTKNGTVSINAQLIKQNYKASQYQRKKQVSIQSLRLQRGSIIERKKSRNLQSQYSEPKHRVIEQHFNLSNQLLDMSNGTSPTFQERLIMISVQDNGQGIAANKLSQIHRFLDDDDVEDEFSRDNSEGMMLGLRASNQIIKHLNGNKEQFHGLKVESDQSLGTIITLSLRIQMCPSNDNNLLLHKDSNYKDSLGDVDEIGINSFHNITVQQFKPWFDNKYTSLNKNIATSETQLVTNSCKCETEILIVDDEPYNLIVLESLLAKLSQKVIKADDGKEAISIMIKRLTQAQIHKCKAIKAIIMDYQMPLVNGEKATKQILQFCQDKGIQPIPIFGLTGFSAEQDIKRLLNVGMIEVFVKPVTMSKLNIMLQKLQNNSYFRQRSHIDIEAQFRSLEIYENQDNNQLRII